MSGDSVRVITTCTSRKVIGSAVPAERLYIGSQHRRLMEGVDTLRRVRQVETWVISAKAGVVPGDQILSAYDESFTELSRSEARLRADSLDIPGKIRTLASEPSALTLLLAGNEYFDAGRLDEPVEWAAPTIGLVSPRSAARFPRHPHVRIMSIGQREARRFALPLTLLKGELAKRLLTAIASGVSLMNVLEQSRPVLDELAAQDGIALAS